jgi:hypothetical protein
MSLSPENVPPFSTPEAAPAEAPKVVRRWQARLLGICFALFTFEIGLFLVIFPWMDDTWDLNYFNSVLPALQAVWDDPYFRGALTGLGLVNIFIACQEVIRALKRS